MPGLAGLTGSAGTDRSGDVSLELGNSRGRKVVKVGDAITRAPEVSGEIGHPPSLRVTTRPIKICVEFLEVHGVRRNPGREVAAGLRECNQVGAPHLELG